AKRQRHAASFCGSGTRTAGVIAPLWCVTWDFSACWFTAANLNCNRSDMRFRTHLATHRRNIMADRTLLRLSATLLFIGQLVNVVLIFLHPHGAGNDQTTFTVFANSSSWAALHLGQFVATA